MSNTPTPLMYERSCRTKEKEDHAGAVIQKLQLEKKWGGRYCVYLCKFCNHWHVGHNDRGKKRQRVREEIKEKGEDLWEMVEDIV